MEYLLGARATRCVLNTINHDRMVEKIPVTHAEWDEYYSNTVTELTQEAFLAFMEKYTDAKLGRISNCGKVTVARMRYAELLLKDIPAQVPLTDRDRNRRTLCAAAVMGHTNMGMECPTKERVQELMKMDTDRFPWALSNYVEAISGYLFESEEHQEIFLGESESWVGTCEEEPFLASWPEKAALFERTDDE